MFGVLFGLGSVVLGFGLAWDSTSGDGIVASLKVDSLVYFLFIKMLAFSYILYLT